MLSITGQAEVDDQPTSLWSGELREYQSVLSQAAGRGGCDALIFFLENDALQHHHSTLEIVAVRPPVVAMLSTTQDSRSPLPHG